MILESAASKLHDELKDCMSYMHEKWYEVQTANKRMASVIGQVGDSVLERLNTMTDEFGTTLETYKYRVDESFSWLQSKTEEKLDLLCKKEEFVTGLQTLNDTVASLGKKLDEHGTTPTKLLEFMKSFAQSLQETQDSMAEQQKTFADQQKRMGEIKENMGKFPAPVDKIKRMLPETLNYLGDGGGFAEQAQCRADGSACRPRGGACTSTGGVQPVTSQPATAPQVQKAQFKPPP